MSARIREAAARVKDHVGSTLELRATTDRSEALPGAAYVLTAVSTHRYELWEQDFRVPLSHGFRHPLGENGGPGAIFHALRSFKLIMPICRDIERLCPDALLLNFTNPEARVLDAISHLTSVRAAGLCHGVFSAIAFISAQTGLPVEQLEVTSAGINHFYYVLSAVDRESGEDKVIVPGRRFTAMAEDGAGHLWLLDQEGRLARYDGAGAVLAPFEGDQRFSQIQAG